MKNGLDEQYIDLLKDILENGVEKETRNGKTLSVFGRSIRYKFKDGKFPAITTKKLAFKTMVTELLWFLQGRTDLRYLLENGCHIWTGDAYKVYDKDFDAEHPPFSAPYPPRLTMQEFEQKIMDDDEFNRMYGDLGPIYGKQWRSWNKKEFRSLNDGNFGYTYDDKPIDQIANLINDLKTNPDSRRLMVSAWNVSDLPNQVLPPCHYGFQVYTRELSLNERGELFRKTYPGKSVDDFAPGGMEVQSLTHQLNTRYDNANIPTRAVSLMWNQRSVDTFLGLPFNIASYGLLLTMLADEVNMVPDELIGNLGDTHLYKNHIEQAKEQITRECYPLPQVQIQDGIYSNMPGDIKLVNYQHHPSIKAPLSN
jgi:thymidylate synthase